MRDSRSVFRVVGEDNGVLFGELVIFICSCFYDCYKSALRNNDTSYSTTMLLEDTFKEDSERLFKLYPWTFLQQSHSE